MPPPHTHLSLSLRVYVAKNVHLQTWGCSREPRVHAQNAGFDPQHGIDQVQLIPGHLQFLFSGGIGRRVTVSLTASYTALLPETSS